MTNATYPAVSIRKRTPSAHPARFRSHAAIARAPSVGVAPRGIVYRDRIWHGATGVLVRSGDGERVYLHRRSPDKLIFPGAHDCWAGGVLGPGEAPAEGAARELAEELGIAGVALVPIERFAYDGAGIRCHTFTYEVRWDGPVRHQPEEVVWGGWVTLDELRAVLADPVGWPFVPDGRVGITRWFALRGRPLPG